MKVEYDGEPDTLTVILRQGVVAESDEDRPGSFWTTTTRGTCSLSKSSMRRGGWKSPGT